MNAKYRERVCPTVRQQFISPKTTQQLSMKFGISGLDEYIPREYNFGLCRSDITSVLYKAEI
jgi:hypothetical protein